jgi:hypothetical protein
MRCIAFLFIAAFAAPAAAQSLLKHKCGIEYQETPCAPPPIVVHEPGSGTPTQESYETSVLRQGVADQRKQSLHNQECMRYQEEVSRAHYLQSRGDGDARALSDRIRQIESQRTTAGC